MAIVRAQVTLPLKTGLPEDVIVNTWHFATGGSTPTALECDDIEDALIGFYSSLDGYLSPALKSTTDAAIIRCYHLVPGSPGAEDDSAGSPISEEAFTLTTGSGAAFPNKVACALSFNGNLTGVLEESGSTRPASRRRGRVYLGPLMAATSEVDSNGNVRPTAEFRGNIITAAVGMQNSLQAETNAIDHVVYSPTVGQGFVVVNYWMDNSYDTMRGRGVASTSRLEASA